jgi:hypothetical protein
MPELLDERGDQFLKPETMRRLIGPDLVEPRVDELAHAGFDLVADLAHARHGTQDALRDQAARRATRRRAAGTDPCPKHGTSSTRRRHLASATLGIDWATAPFDVDQFRIRMKVELEHGLHDPHTNVSDDNPHVTSAHQDRRRA